MDTSATESSPSVAEISRYFPSLSDIQLRQLEMAGPLYTQWNSKINVISRKDIDNIYTHHILHSMAIGKFITPRPGTRLLDLGCGGGFPGIPLAILWPQCRFHLIDRVGKKITVARSVARELGLQNVTFQHGDAGECHEKFDFVVSRAVMRLDALAKLARRNISRKSMNKLPNGLICLKGGDLAPEIQATGGDILRVPLTDYFSDPYFMEKELIYTPL